MSIILEFIGPILGLTSAIVTLYAFFKNKIKHNILFLVSTLIFSSVIVIAWDSNKQKEYDFELLSTKQKYEAQIAKVKDEILSKDAKAIADSIIITGYEDYGDYLAYLATMTGFYKRHNHKYEQEYLVLSRQLTEWQDELRDLRKSGESIDSGDYDGLKGLVKSTKDYLANVGNGS